MTSAKMSRMTVASLVLATAASLAGVAPVAAAAGASGTVAGAVSAPTGRQLLGQVSGPAYFEASPPAAGSYAVEYEITGSGFFDTYVDEVELSYVGGPAGIYRTRALSLSEGGHLVHVVGPEGSGTASVYLVQVS